jgi:hypothetical protein
MEDLLKEVEDDVVEEVVPGVVEEEVLQEQTVSDPYREEKGRKRGRSRLGEGREGRRERETNE